MLFTIWRSFVRVLCFRDVHVYRTFSHSFCALCEVHPVNPRNVYCKKLYFSSNIVADLLFDKSWRNPHVIEKFTRPLNFFANIFTIHEKFMYAILQELKRIYKTCICIYMYNFFVKIFQKLRLLYRNLMSNFLMFIIEINLY